MSIPTFRYEYIDFVDQVLPLMQKNYYLCKEIGLRRK